MSSSTSSLTTAMDAFKCTPFLSPWRRTSCPVTPPRDGRTNLKHFLMEQRPLLALKYPFLTPQQIKRRGKELWCKLSSKAKKANTAAPSMRLPTPPRERVCEEMGKRHFPFRLPHDEPLSMFSSPPVRSSRKSLPAFPSSMAGHQGAVVSQSSRRTSGIINNDSDKMLAFRKPPPEKTYAEGSRWPCRVTECKQSGILKRSQNARKTTGDRRVSFAEANYSPDGTSIEGCRHGNDLQTNDQYMEKSPDSRRERQKSLGSNVTNRRMSLDGHIKQPIGLDKNGESSAKIKINQPDWSKLKTAPEIEDGEGLNSDSDAEREFQLACLHREAEPVLPHGGFAMNCRQSKPRRRSCDERLMARKKPQPGKKPGRTGRKEKDGHVDSRGDDQSGNKVHYGEGDRYVTQRNTTHQWTMTSRQNDKKHTSHADAKQRVTNSITVYDMFDEADSEMIDFSQTKFSDYRENVKHTTQTTRRRTIACAGNRRQMFMQEDDHMNHQPARGEVGDHIAAKCDKLHDYQYRNMTAPRQAKTDDRHGFRTRDSVIQNMSSPSCYNLRSQKGYETELTSTDRCEGWQDARGKVVSPKPCRELSHGRGRKQGVGYGKTRNNKPVHFAPPGVNVQIQERLMTPETAEEIVAATLTNVICAPRKRRAAEHDIPTGEKMKCRAEEIEGRVHTGKALGNGRGEYRMDRVRKRLVASAGEPRAQMKKQKTGAENTANVCSRKLDKVVTRAGGKPDCTSTHMAVPRHRPYTRSSVRAHSVLSLCDTDSGTQMAWESTEEDDGIPHQRSTVDKHAQNRVSSGHKRRDLHRNNDSVKVPQRFKVGSDVGDSLSQRQSVSTGTVAQGDTRRPQAVSPLFVLQNLTNQDPSGPTCTLSSPVKSDASSSRNPDESTNDSMSPFPYVSPLPSSNASSGVGASFWSLMSLSQQAKRLQSDLDNVMSSSEDEFPAPVKNDVLSRAVRSMQQLTAPPGGPNSPRRTSVLSPSVSGISELSQLSSLFESAMQTTSPEPKGLGKNPVGSTVSGKITTRELDSTTPPRGDARLGTSPIRKRARKTTRRELQPVRSLKMKPPKLEPPQVKPSCAGPPRTRPSTQSSLCDLFDDVKPGNKQLGNRRVVASLPAATAENFDELFSPGEHDIFL